VGSSRGGGLYALLWVQRMFPGHFRNFVFVNARTVDSHPTAQRGYETDPDGGNVALTISSISAQQGLAAKSYLAFGTDPVDEVAKLAQQVHDDFPNCISSRANWCSSARTGSYACCTTRPRWRCSAACTCTACKW